MRRRRTTSRLSLVLAAGVLAASAGLGDAASASPPAGPAARIGNVKVCPYQLFSNRSQQCTRDTRSVVLTTNRVTCSALIVLEHASVLRTTMSYDGGSVGGWDVQRWPAGAHRVWFAYTIATEQPLPTGAWTCSFAVGSVRKSVAFYTAGPTGDVVDIAVCAGEDTIGSYTDGLCAKDESVAGVLKTDLIVCSLYITHRVGSVPRIDIVDPAGRAISSYTGSKITEPFWPVWAWAKATSPPFAFGPGAYSCRVSLDDELAATKTFDVLG